MTKNKFAGLAEAKLKSLDEEGSDGSVETPPKEKAIKPASKKTVKQESKKASLNDATVGVTIKIPESKRIWWNVQAKLQRTTVTEAIIEALDRRFGEPKF
jgi:hypothetical protein